MSWGETHCTFATRPSIWIQQVSWELPKGKLKKTEMSFGLKWRTVIAVRGIHHIALGSSFRRRYFQKRSPSCIEVYGMISLIKWKLKLWKVVSLDHEILFQCLASCYRPFGKVLGSQTYRKWDRHREDGTVVPLRCSSGTKTTTGIAFRSLWPLQ